MILHFQKELADLSSFSIWFKQADIKIEKRAILQAKNILKIVQILAIDSVATLIAKNKTTFK